MTKDTRHAEPLIRVEDLRAGFDDHIVLDGVSFDVPAGEVFVILGGSGSGKSTLLKHMVGIHAPLSGHVFFRDRDIVSAEGDGLRDILRSFGVMYQSGALFGSMSLLENMRLPLEEFTELPDEAMDLIARMKLSLVGLSGFEEHMPSELSGGMQKRAAIARAMALDPDILFLDEPSAGLDPITSAELDRLILRLRESLNITFVVVTHELPSIYTIADRVIVLDGSKKNIVAEGDPTDLRDHSDNDFVRRFFARKPLE